MRRGALWIALFYLLGLSALVPLVWILFSIVINGLPVILKYGWQLFVNNIPPPIFFFGTPKVGIAPAIVGTLLVVTIAFLISFPIGFLAGIVISEFGHTRVGRLVEDLASTLVEVPTITAGVSVYWLLVVPVKGFSAFAGGVALSLIMIPYIALYTAESYRRVPKVIKEGGLALGLKYTTVLFRVLKGLVLPGVVSGALMAIAKGAGEAAPLLFTAGWSDKVSLDPFKPVSTLSVLIYKFGFSSQELWLELSWAASFILVFMIILPLIILSKVLVKKHVV